MERWREALIVFRYHPHKTQSPWRTRSRWRASAGVERMGGVKRRENMTPDSLTVSQKLC